MADAGSAMRSASREVTDAARAYAGDVKAMLSMAWRWGKRFLKWGMILLLLIVQSIVGALDASAECGTGTGTDDTAIAGGAYPASSSAGNPDPAIVKMAYDAVKARYGTSKEGDLVMLATFETALVESGFRNLNYGDRDSLGVMQQRAGWGTAQQRMNPQYAIGKFLAELNKVLPKYTNSEPHVLAQAVQRSAFASGSNYKAKEAQATRLIQEQGGFITGSANMPVLPRFAVPTVQGQLDRIPGTTNANGEVDSWVPVANGACEQVGLAGNLANMAGQANVSIQTSGEWGKGTKTFTIDKILEGQRGKAISEALGQATNRTPYLWGGTTWNAGLDCSGLTQGALKRAGVSIPRVAAAQYGATKPIAEESALPGDLLFWGGANAHHVAIYLGPGKDANGNPVELMVHAPKTGDVVRVAEIYGSPTYGRPPYTDPAPGAAPAAV